MKKAVRRITKLVVLGVFLIGIAVSVYLFNSRFPLRYVDIIEHYATVHNVDPILVASIINVESRFRPYVVSSAGASGLMQIMPGTAKWAAQHLGIYDFVYDDMIFDPEININIGTWYIARLINSHEELDVALAAYNAGSGNVASWLSDETMSPDGVTLDYIPFGETRRYVERVNMNLHIYNFRLWLHRFIN